MIIKFDMDKFDYILYGIVVIICLLIININMTITNTTISNCYNKDISNFDGSIGSFEVYTREQIIQNWNATGCTIPLSNEIIAALSAVPKDTADGMIDFYKRSTYKCGYNKMPSDPTTLSSTSSTTTTGAYTPDQIAELKGIWTKSNCTAPYPTEYVNTLQKYNYSIGKKKFTKYVNDIVKNNKYNDVYYMSLDKTFAECYGGDWKKNKSLLNAYYKVSAL